MLNIDSFYAQKTILLIGSCGSIGTSLVEYISKYLTPSRLLCIDCNEASLFSQSLDYRFHQNISFRMADPITLSSLNNLVNNFDVVINVAARKNVVMCERSPQLCLDSNINLVSRLLDAVEGSTSPTLFIHTSTDKAVNPTNLMGASKLLGEKLVTAASSRDTSSQNKFVLTRFGNVLGSSGSVIPIFLKQITSNNDITLTDLDMTRYVMSAEQAVSLILNSPLLADTGDIVISDMPSIRIHDLALSLIELVEEYFQYKYSASIKVIGAFPGEKLYEELVSPEELRRTQFVNGHYIIKPALPIGTNYSTHSSVSSDSLNSSTSALITKDQLRHLLPKPFLANLLDSLPPSKRHWPGDTN